MEGLIILSLDGKAAVALSSDAVKFAYPARRDQSESELSWTRLHWTVALSAAWVGGHVSRYCRGGVRLGGGAGIYLISMHVCHGLFNCWGLDLVDDVVGYALVVAVAGAVTAHR
ncbi:hypothetical protein An13g02740 [Aspergillus niger]|uniref:Uncharacterized protein n=2 Tax=Aspergillus niger TaxID=5061 RepID=A2R1X1_ASPNC|nr:hypothetical protein An13g02740 [Aspergillus niger]CAK41671.1 hypothetical protein An13g02740 [Aspergillus niger]